MDNEFDTLIIMVRYMELALRDIAGSDFRGNKPHECYIASKALRYVEALDEGHNYLLVNCRKKHDKS